MRLNMLGFMGHGTNAVYYFSELAVRSVLIWQAKSSGCLIQYDNYAVCVLYRISCIYTHSR